MRRPHERRRWWTLYTADGQRLGEVDFPEAVIRATLPGAVIDRSVGSVTLQDRPVGTGVLVPAAERSFDDA
jgi:hypothetical protein